MLQVLSQTNLDLTMFIGNDEPNFKLVGLNLGLLKKGFHCDGTGAIATTFMPDSNGKNIEGLRTRFTKTEGPQAYDPRYRYSSYKSSSARSFFKRKMTTDLTATELTISRGLRSNRTEITLRIVPSSEDRKKLLDVDIISRYSRHIKTTEDMAVLPNIQSSVEINNDDFKTKTDEQEEAAKLHMDSAVARTKEFEESFKYLYPLLVLRNFTGTSNSTIQQISLAEFDKFSRQLGIFEEVSIPTKCARKKFIEICEIFRDNKVLTKLKANNFEFNKNNKHLMVSFFGIQLVNEENFKHFQYFDHPGINFCADFLDKSRTFDTVETKISKEIITRI